MSGSEGLEDHCLSSRSLYSLSKRKYLRLNRGNIQHRRQKKKIFLHEVFLSPLTTGLHHTHPQWLDPTTTTTTQKPTNTKLHLHVHVFSLSSRFSPHLTRRVERLPPLGVGLWLELQGPWTAAWHQEALRWETDLIPTIHPILKMTWPTDVCVHPPPPPRGRVVCD